MNRPPWSWAGLSTCAGMGTDWEERCGFLRSVVFIRWSFDCAGVPSSKRGGSCNAFTWPHSYGDVRTVLWRGLGGREREIVNAACFGIMVERTYRNKDKYKESRRWNHYEYITTEIMAFKRKKSAREILSMQLGME